MLRLVDELMPALVFMENVPAVLKLGFIGVARVSLIPPQQVVPQPVLAVTPCTNMHQQAVWGTRH